MDMKIPGAVIGILLVALMAVFTSGLGCVGGPQPTQLSGTMVTDIDYEVVEETVVISADKVSQPSRLWVYVECDYWAGCYMRCDGTKNKCLKLASDAQLKVTHVVR